MWLILLAGCGGDSEVAAMRDDAYDTGIDGDGGADYDDTGGAEQEDDYLRLAPAATDAWVFVANPDRDTVTRVAIPELTLETRPVGKTPSVVLVTPDFRRAVTLNEGSDSVSIIEAASFEIREVAIRENFNTLAISPDGRWALAWYDPDRESLGQDGGVQSFNEVSFVDLDAGVHTPLAVGFNPQGVRWTPDGARALVVSDGALAVIDLAVSPLSPTTVPIADDPLDAPPAEEVELTWDGEWAWVRRQGADTILLVNLGDLSLADLGVGRNPTDLDLSPDGRTITVVARSDAELWLYDVADPFAEPRTVAIPDSGYGSVTYAGAGERAVLYTNASLVPRFAVWQPGDDTIVEKTLVKPVESIGIDPTGGSMLVFHTLADAADGDPSSPFYGEYALSLVDLHDFRQNPMRLPEAVSGYSTTDDGAYGYFIMEGEPLLEKLDFGTLLYDEVELKSPAAFVGAVPRSHLAWVSQVHELGRMTFYDPDAGTVDTVTGFELNSEIDHEEE